MKGFIGKRKWTGFWRSTRRTAKESDGAGPMFAAILPVGKRRAKIMRREQEQRESR